MSQADPSTAIQLLSDDIATIFVNFAGLTLLIYDTLLTLPSEVRYIWCKDVKIGSILYLFARYLPWGSFLVAVYLDLSKIFFERKCNDIIRLCSAFAVPSLIGVQGLLLARTYAISFQKQRVLGVLGLLILGVIITDVYSIVLETCTPTSSQLNTSALLATIESATVILSDTGVVIVTVLSSIETLKLWQKGAIWDKKSLISLLIYQGFVRYGFVLTISLASTITTKVLRPSIGKILGPFQNSLSIIIVCRFHLTIKERHSQLHNPSLSTLSFSTFQVARQSVHNAIVAEFGNPQDFIAETSQDDVADQENQQSPEEARSAGIELEEFPWATGYSGDVELAGPAVSRYGRMAEV